MPMREALRQHWPEYLIEAWALGSFMVCIGLFVTLLEAPQSLLYPMFPSPLLRAALLGFALGVTTIVLIHSPWGQRSGAHMNPAVTLAFLRLKKIHPWDAAFFVVAQIIGGTLGVMLVTFVLGVLFTGPPINYARTEPGPLGDAVAFIAEATISFCLMATVLVFSASARLAASTGLAVGAVVAIFIAFEAPLSGASMNPARTFASAAPGQLWQHFWIYLFAPTLGMLLAAQLHLRIRGLNAPGCAKLFHAADTRCIHCGQGITIKARSGVILMP